jgi:hypothetical protein
MDTTTINNIISKKKIRNMEYKSILDECLRIIKIQATMNSRTFTFYTVPLVTINPGYNYLDCMDYIIENVKDLQVSKMYPTHQYAKLLKQDILHRTLFFKWNVIGVSNLERMNVISRLINKN